MKRKIRRLFCVAVAIMLVCATMLSGCFLDGCFGGDKDETPKERTIQYTDDEGVHTLTVTDGMPYYIEAVPHREGYEFLGLFDAESGGKQYVNADGASVSVFGDKKNIVLFPQFKAKAYAFILDYQGAAVTGERQFTAEYGSSLPKLPDNLTLAHKKFRGWFTKENCDGKQVADEYGLVPAASAVNGDNFDLSKIVTLYAGFEPEKYAVTFNFGSAAEREICEIEYDTPVNRIVPDTRVDGKAVLTWSKTEGGEIFNGKITGETVLYAVEYAPVIELDADGGDGIIPVVARAGDNVTLPAPTKALSEFLYWVDANGNEAEIEKMPENGASLKAVWQAKIVFDENGGSDVSDISKAPNTAITLPTPQREDYIFAGWYTDGKEPYTTGKMPATGVALKAGWYKANEKIITVVENDTGKALVVSSSNTLTKKQRVAIDLSKEFTNMPSNGVDVSFTVNFKWGNQHKYCKAEGQLALYDGGEFNSNYELARKSLSHGDGEDSYLYDSFGGKARINSKVLYLYYAGKGDLHITLSGGYGANVAFYNINLTLFYPDTSQLYL